MSMATKIAGLKSMMAFTNKWQLIFNRLLFSRTSDVYVMRDTQFIVDYAGGDATGTRECIVSEMYRQYLPLMKLSGVITVLDIGANGGGFPLLLRINGYKLKKAVCVEMNPKTFNRLRYNMYSNFNDTCVCINEALTDFRGSIDVTLGAGSTSDSLNQSKKKAGNKEWVYTITTTTLNHLITTQFGSEIDIVKMDIEGAEYDVLFNKGSESLKRARYFLLEIHNNPNVPKESLVARIRSFGFSELLADKKAKEDVYCFANGNLPESP